MEHIETDANQTHVLLQDLTFFFGGSIIIITVFIIIIIIIIIFMSIFMVIILIVWSGLGLVGRLGRPGVSGEELIDAQTSLSQLRFHEEKHPVHRHRHRHHHRDGEDGDHNVFSLEDQ